MSWPRRCECTKGPMRPAYLSRHEILQGPCATARPAFGPPLSRVGLDALQRSHGAGALESIEHRQLRAEGPVRRTLRTKHADRQYQQSLPVVVTQGVAAAPPDHSPPKPLLIRLELPRPA